MYYTFQATYLPSLDSTKSDPLPLRLVTFETCDQSDQETSPDQKDFQTCRPTYLSIFLPLEITFKEPSHCHPSKESDMGSILNSCDVLF